MAAETDSSSRPNVFLSHRYRSPDVNLFFWRIIRKVQPVAFRVDEGLTFTSPTRLERMMRDADGFVGIYPLPGDPQAAWDLRMLQQEARYFLLELSIAARLRYPSIVFCDHRYGALFRCPPEIRVVEYDPQEITDEDDSPLIARVTRAFETFTAGVRARISARAGTRSYRKREVGLLLDRNTRAEIGDALESGLEEAVWQPVNLAWPPRLDLTFVSRLRELDWLVVALDDPAAYVAASFAAGHGVPTLPLLHSPADRVPDQLSAALFEDVQPRHSRRVLSWRDRDDLRTSFEETLTVIGRQPRLFHDADQAGKYFTTAALRKEVVFLSYANEDKDTAQLFSRALHARFQQVFDYRKTGSIRTGQNWLDELMDRLAKTAVGVLLLSPSYIASPYCVTEAQRLYQASIEGRATLLPVRLEPVELPEFLKGIQYRRLPGNTESDVEAAVRELVELLGDAETGEQ
ncbi:TIR domain-containing protein [Nocardia beijingensis]